MKELRRTVIQSSLLLYIAACFMPVVNFKDEAMSGGFALLCGLLVSLRGKLAWLANPLLLLAWVSLAYGKDRRAACVAALALLCGINTWGDIYLNPFHWIQPPGHLIPEVFDTEKILVDRVREGTYFWLASMAVVLVGSVWIDRKSQQTRHRVPS